MSIRNLFKYARTKDENLNKALLSAKDQFDVITRAVNTGTDPAAHILVGPKHTESGLTAGHFLKAASPTTFGFAAHGLVAADVGAPPTSRAISTTAPLAGGGDLSADRSLALAGLSSLGTADYYVKVNHTGSAWKYQKGLVIDVRDYGATGDGVTDDTAALQAAFTACPDGGAIFIPEGTYLFSAALYLAQGKMLFGCGYKSILKMVTPHTYGLVVYHDCILEDFALQGNYTHTTYPSNSTAINAVYTADDFWDHGNDPSLWNSLRIKVRRLTVYDWGMNGIAAGPWWEIENCYIYHIFNEGIWSGGDHAVIQHNWIEDVNSWGIDMNGRYNICSENRLYDCGDRVALASTDGGGICSGGRNRIVGNTIRTSTGSGIYLWDAAFTEPHFGHVWDCVVVDNDIDDVLTNVAPGTIFGAIHVTGASAGCVSNLVIANNTIRLTTGATDYEIPIYVVNAHGFTITGNTIYGTSHFEGIVLNGESKNFSITGNIVKNCHAGFAFFNASATALYGTIAHNDFKENGTPVVWGTNVLTEVNIYANGGDMVGICFRDGSVGFGTTSPATSALLDLTSSNKAILISRMNTTQRDALTAVNGMIIYNSTLNKFQGYENGTWASFV